MQVLKPGWSWWPGMLDVYPNHALVSKIQAPVLIMHVSPRWHWISVACAGSWEVLAALGIPPGLWRKCGDLPEGHVSGGAPRKA